MIIRSVNNDFHFVESRPNALLCSESIDYLTVTTSHVNWTSIIDAKPVQPIPSIFGLRAHDYPEKEKEEDSELSAFFEQMSIRN